MIKRIIAALAMWSCGIAALLAADAVTVADLSGNVGESIELSVGLSTDSPEAVAAEIHIPLPEGVSVMAGSCAKSATRLPDHSISADIRNGELVAVIFNTSLTPIPVGSGEAFTLRLLLGENPGEFTLSPTLRLSNAAGQAIPATANGGTLTIYGARLELSATDIDFGRVPIRDTYTRSVTATNTGTATLAIAHITTDVPGLTVTADDESIAPGGSTTLNLSYNPTQRAKSIAGRFTVESNSVGRAPFVRVTSVPFSVNELHVGSAQGISDSDVTVTVTMNNMEPITGAEVTFTLPEALDYVEGSLTPASRATAFSAASNVGSGRKLRLILFNSANQSVDGNDGELLSFKLKLSGRSGGYSLSPERVILSNAGGENMVSATTSGYVSISSPSLSASSTFDIGNVPLSGTDTFDYELYNSSSVPLTIERVAFLDEVAECRGAFPMVVDPYASSAIPVSIKSPTFGDFASVMNIYSNDPDNRLKSVKITGNFYSANELTVDGALDGENYVMTAALTNEADIVALQLDVTVPDGVALASTDLQLLDRASTHSATLASVGKNLYRIIIFSLNNTPFTGSEGAIFTLRVKKDAVDGKQFIFDHIKLSNSNGLNFTNPNTETITLTVPVFVKELLLSEETLTLNPGKSAQLTVTTLPGNAGPAQLLWSSSATDVATVDAQGNVTAVAVGQTVIRVSLADNPNVYAECTVIVEREVIPVTSITLSETSLTLNPGKLAKLTVTTLPENADETNLIWTSSAEEVVIVDAEGNITAVAIGEAVIRVSVEGNPEVYAECNVTVEREAIPVTGITLSETALTLNPGKSAKLIVTTLPENADEAKLIWTSSAEEVATVDAEGNVTAVAVGEAVIRVSVEDKPEVYAECNVTVEREAIPVTGITLSETALTLNPGKSAKLTVTTLPENADEATLVWNSSADEVVTVDADGNVTAIAIGKAIIRVSIEGNPEVYAECTVTVEREAIPVTGITLSETTLTLNPGKSAKLTVTTLPENADEATLVWNSSAYEVATVDADGNVTAIAVGEAVIRVSVEGNPDVYAECTVRVEREAIPVTGIKLSQTSLTLKGGWVEQLTVTLLPEDADDVQLVWTSSDSSIASVHTNGEVVGGNAGVAIIRVSVESNPEIFAECTVTVDPDVEPVPVTSIQLSDSILQLEEGNSFILSTLVFPVNAYPVELVWSSYDDRIASVDGFGKVTAHKAGNTVIRVESASDPSVYAECDVKVDIAVGVDGIADDGEVKVVDRTIFIPGAVARYTVRVFTPDGQLIGAYEPSGEAYTIDLPYSGIYLLQTVQRTIKLIVR